MGCNTNKGFPREDSTTKVDTGPTWCESESVLYNKSEPWNSAFDMLAGEMILTFYKPAKIAKASKPRQVGTRADSAVALSEVFESCLTLETTSFFQRSSIQPIGH